MNTAFRRELEDDRSFVVDCIGLPQGQGCRAAADGALHDGKAQDDGHPQEMGPLNPYERRIVHLAVAEDPRCRSESIGDAFMKTVIISVSRQLAPVVPSAAGALRVATCSPPTTPSSRLRRRPAAAASASSASAVPTRTRGGSTAHASTAREPLEPRHATLTRERSRRRRRGRRSIRSSSRSSPRRIPTPARTSSKSARTAARSCCARSCARRCAAGARLAEPGEFTLRAFLNGRIDLVQAEAVADLIDAVTPLQARAAFDQLEGTLTDADRARSMRALFDLIARLEASLDFPDEGYHFIDAGEAAARARARSSAQIDALLADARARPADSRGLPGRDRRPAERRQVEPVQRARWRARAIVTDMPARRAIWSPKRSTSKGCASRSSTPPALREAPRRRRARRASRGRAQARDVADLVRASCSIARAPLTADDDDAADRRRRSGVAS